MHVRISSCEALFIDLTMNLWVYQAPCAPISPWWTNLSAWEICYLQPLPSKHSLLKRVWCMLFTIARALTLFDHHARHYLTSTLQTPLLSSCFLPRLGLHFSWLQASTILYPKGWWSTEMFSRSFEDVGDGCWTTLGWNINVLIPNQGLLYPQHCLIC